jgi:MFS family permease
MKPEEVFPNPIDTQKKSILIEAVIYLLFFLGPLTGNVIYVLFRVLSVEFEVSQSALLIAIPSFMFPFSIIQLFSGAISDIKGRVLIILIGLFLFGIGMLIAAISNSLIMYAIANVLGGIGFGFVNPVLIALMTDLTERSKIPKKMGYLGAVANLGVGLSPIIAGQLISTNWRLIYIIFILITILGFLLLMLLKHPSGITPEDKGVKTFLSHLFSEIQRPVIMLMVISAFLASLTYLATIIWTSRAFAGLIPEELTGIIVGSAGIMGAIFGLVIGNIIENKGIEYAIFIALISLFTGVIILLIIGDTTNKHTLIFTLIGLLFIGAAGGSIIPSIMFYSQTLSKQRRGALAGLATAGQFIGIALTPTTYQAFFNLGGIAVVYLAIFIVTFVFLVIFLLLYLMGKRNKQI